MLCIVSFFILLILSIFSAPKRKLLKQSWSCVTRRVTFRACDASFAHDIRTKALAPVALKAPRLVRPLSGLITIAAWVTIISLVSMVYIVLRGGLNLIAYGTCDKAEPEACLLTGQEACGIPSDEPGFLDHLRRGNVVGAFTHEITSMGDTLRTIGTRFRHWDAAEFAPEYASFKGGYREGLPVVMEILDPGCIFCARLAENIAESGIAETTNVTYLLYPILREGEPEFPHSYLIAQYLTAIRIFEHGTPAADDPTDWALLYKLFSGNEPTRGVNWQIWFNSVATHEQALGQLHTWLAELGFLDADIAQVSTLAASDQVAQILNESRYTVDHRIRTITIPTLIADGSIHRGLVTVDQLRRMG